MHFARERYIFELCQNIGGNKFSHRGEILRSGSKAEDGEKEKEKKRGAKVGDNNGQATHGARKHAWRTQAAWAKRKPIVTV